MENLARLEMLIKLAIEALPEGLTVNWENVRREIIRDQRAMDGNPILNDFGPMVFKTIMADNPVKKAHPAPGPTTVWHVNHLNTILKNFHFIDGKADADIDVATHYVIFRTEHEANKYAEATRKTGKWKHVKVVPVFVNETFESYMKPPSDHSAPTCNCPGCHAVNKKREERC
jgi:hypothetical protein